MQPNQQVERRNPTKDIRDIIKSMEGEITRALPRHMKADRMIRVMLTTVNGNPKLLQCSKESLLAALMKCSQYGLEPDGRHAHLIPYGQECQLIFDYKGLASLIRRTGEVTEIHCDVVREGDEFKLSYGSNGTLFHRPNLKAGRGEVYCAYSFVRMKNGGASYDVMTTAEINAVMEASQGYQAFKAKKIKSNPWDGHWPEMAKKTVFRRHSKLLPLSFELQEAINGDDDKSEEQRFAAAKPAKVEEQSFLPEPTGEPGPSKQMELCQLCKASRISFTEFNEWAAQFCGGPFADFDSVPDDVAADILGPKREVMLKALQKGGA